MHDLVYKTVQLCIIHNVVRVLISMGQQQLQGENYGGLHCALEDKVFHSGIQV